MNDDTVMIKPCCGTCYFFKPAAGIPANDTPGDADVIVGRCFYNPPIPHLVQSRNALQQAQLGQTDLRPAVKSDTDPCSGWCPKDIDPFGDTSEYDAYGHETPPLVVGPEQ